LAAHYPVQLALCKLLGLLMILAVYLLFASWHVNCFIVWQTLKPKGGEKMRTNLAIQKSPRGYRLVSFLPFKDEEGNQALEIIACYNQSETEWYEDKENAIQDAKDFVFNPAPWSVSTTFFYLEIGPSIKDLAKETAYFLKRW